MFWIVALIIFLVLIYVYHIITDIPDGIPPGDLGYPIFGRYFSTQSELHQIIRNMAKKHKNMFSVKVGSKIMIFLSDFDTIKKAWEETVVATNNAASNIFTHHIKLKLSRVSALTPQDSAFCLVNPQMLSNVSQSSVEEAMRREWTYLSHFIDEGNFGVCSLVDALHSSFINIMSMSLGGTRYEMGDICLRNYLNMNEKLKNFILSEKLRFFEYFPILSSTIPNFVKRKYFNLEELKELLETKKKYLQKIQKNVGRMSSKLNQNGQFSNNDYSAEKFVEDNYKNLQDAIICLLDADMYNIFQMLRWTLWYMIAYPKVQAKIRQELKQNIGKNKLPGLKDINNLPYLEATLHEVKRISNVLPMGYNGHSPSCEAILNGHRLPQDSVVFTFNEHSHKDPKYWSQPEIFMPDRFLNKIGTHHNNKIGYPLHHLDGTKSEEGILSSILFLMVALLLQRFEFTSGEERITNGTNHNSKHSQNTQMDCAPVCDVKVKIRV